MSRGGESGKYTGLYAALFPYAMFFTVCAVFTMSCVQHGGSSPRQKKTMLENFNVDD